LHDLAEKLALTPNRTLALVKHLKLQESEEYFRVVKVGKIEFKRYSPKALDTAHQALPSLNIDEIWKVHKPAGRRKKGGG
jgi:hypothetical protein